MKKFIVPEIEIAAFSVEDIITESGALKTASEQAADTLNAAGAVVSTDMTWVKE